MATVDLCTHAEGSAGPYVEQQCGDRSEPLHVDHGQGVWQVSLARPHKEQPGEMSTKEEEPCIQQALFFLKQQQLKWHSKISTKNHEINKQAI